MKSQFAPRSWFLVFVTAFCFALTCTLGFWQLSRASYKEQMAAQIKTKNQDEKLDNHAVAAIKSGVNTDQYVHRNVQLQGRWLHEYTVFLDNRPMQMQGSQRIGFYVVTPLLLEGFHHAIWVQRGWLARDFQDRQRLPVLLETKEQVQIQGRLMAQVSRTYEMIQMQGKIEKNKGQAPLKEARIWQNLPELDLGVPLISLAVLQTAQSSDNQQDSLQRHWPAPDLGLAKHYGYAFQWFALSALVLVLYVWFQIIVPRRRKNAQN